MHRVVLFVPLSDSDLAPAEGQISPARTGRMIVFFDGLLQLTIAKPTVKFSVLSSGGGTLSRGTNGKGVAGGKRWPARVHAASRQCHDSVIPSARRGRRFENPEIPIDF